MRRPAAATLALAALVAGATSASGAPLDTRGTSVGVSEREFSISPYRRSVPTGTVKFNVRNFGEDVHDLVVLSPRGNRVGSTGEIGAGDLATLRVKLRKPGVYRLLCTQADHSARGMRSRIVARVPSRR